MARLPSLVSLISDLATPIFNSVRQNFRFANGFFQICSRPQHSCQSLMFPINSAHAETYILPA